MKNFIKQRIKSIGYAFSGVLFLIKTEASIQVQLVIAIFITMAGFYYQISPIEWMLQFLAIGLVIGIEAINTTIENVMNIVHPDHNNKIGRIKDTAAGAVAIAAVAAVAVGLIIYLPRVIIS